MEDIILEKILVGKNVLIVGKTNSGKTYFVKNKLIPTLKKNNLKIVYFENCEKLQVDSSDIYIVDEIEILFDKSFLEKNHPKEKPYYSKEYLEKVQKWQNELSKITKPVICVITRNDQAAIDNLVKDYKNLEWNNLPVEIIEFVK